jgi:hypothetical protein
LLPTSPFVKPLAIAIKPLQQLQLLELSIEQSIAIEATLLP